MNIEFEKVVPIKKYASSLNKDSENFLQFFEEAKTEINFYDWCVNIQESYVGMFYSEIIGIFLFKIEPSGNHIDEWVWVVVGDIPPIYITCEDSPNAICALDGYIGAMREWVEAAKNGNSLEGIVPVNVQATPENGEMLESRLNTLESTILNLYPDDLK